MKRVILCKDSASITYRIDIRYYKETDKAYRIPCGYTDRRYTWRFDIWAPKSVRGVSVKLFPNYFDITVPKWIIENNLKSDQCVIEYI